MKKRDSVMMPSARGPIAVGEVGPRHTMRMDLLDLEKWVATATDRSDGGVHSHSEGMKTLDHATYM